MQLFKLIRSRTRAVRSPILAGCCLALVLVFAGCSSGNTSFSKGYSQAKFGSIKEGDSLQTVLTNLGLPLRMTVNFGTSGGLPIEMQSPNESEIEKHLHIQGGNVVLQYSECLHRSGDQFRNVNVTISNGRVQSKRNEIYHEWW